jgi:hypothetical protein
MPRPLASFAVLIALLLTASGASAQDIDGKIPDPVFPTPQLPQAADPPAAAEDHPFEHHWVAIQAIIGLELAVRLQVEFIHLGRLSVIVEGQVGNEIIIVPTGGVGVRFAYRVYQGQCDAFVIAPGIDFVWPIQIQGSIVTRTDLTFLAPSIDFSWVHEFAPHFATELGAQIGADIPLVSNNGGWFAIPQLSVYAGVRF